MFYSSLKINKKNSFTVIFFVSQLFKIKSDVFLMSVRYTVLETNISIFQIYYYFSVIGLSLILFILF